MFFNPQNGQSGTAIICEKNLKLFVDKTHESEAKAYREALSEYLKQDKEFQELQQTLGKQLAEKEAKFSEAFQKYLEILRGLHIAYGRQMANATYNEFDHKIHIEADGRMYVIVKECVIDDLEIPVSIKDEVSENVPNSDSM